MERLARLARRVGWLRHERAEAWRRHLELVEQQERRGRHCHIDLTQAVRRFLRVLESLLLWENSCNSILAVVGFNLLFWGFVVLEVRGFAAASSAALAIVLGYCTLETEEEGAPSSEMSQSKAEQVEKLVKKAKSTFESFVQLQQEQPRAFCTAIGTASLGLWLIARNLDSVLITYAICMSILVGPAIFLRSPCKELSNKEWDSEIEEFLPAVTEDNLQVLKRAGETGDRSPTPQSPVSDPSRDPFNVDDLIGLRMPSHEEGSTDGLELEELELIAGETDIDGIRFQSGHFERGSSSSDDDADLKLKLNDDDDEDDSSDSEFEIIDSHELASLKNV